MNHLFSKIPAIAVVLIDRDVLTLKGEELEGADLIELRVDLFEKIDDIESVFILARSKFSLPILATIRIPSEGGKREFLNRIEIYKKVIPYSDFVDVEILSDDFEKLRDLVESFGKKLIASYHRFDITPSNEELEEILRRSKKANAHITKIATLIEKKDDLERLLLFTINYKRENIIVIGMGETGKPSRVIYPIFGSLMTYASINTLSAPGQIQLRELLNVFRILGLR